MSAKDATDSAMLHAEAHAPFVDTDWAVFASPIGHGVWWWDASRVRHLLGETNVYDPRSMAPETVAHVAGDPWRVILAVDGYEAQYWENAVLRASQWRRRMFDDQQWAGFVASVTDPAIPPPERVPAPGAPLWVPVRTWRRARVTGVSKWRRADRAGWAIAGVALLAALAFFGHAARYRALSAHERAEIARLQSESSQTTANVALVRDAARLASAPQHLIALADMVAAVEASGLAVARWESRAAEVQVVATGDAALDELGAGLEANPRLVNVAPTLEDGVVVVHAEVERSLAALAEGGR